MSKIKNGGLDQYGTEPFKQQPFGTAGVEGVNLQQKMTRNFPGKKQQNATQSTNMPKLRHCYHYV